jgi:transposase-like protein
MDGWGICVDGRQLLLSLSTAHSESDESGREGLRDLVKRGRQIPGTRTTDGAPGLPKAGDVLGPRSLRRRCGFHNMQPLHQQVPPQAWPACKALVADMREAPTFEEGQRRLRHLLAPYPAPFRKRVDAWRRMPRRATIPCRARPGIDNMSTPPPSWSAPVRRNGGAPP